MYAAHRSDSSPTRPKTIDRRITAAIVVLALAGAACSDDSASGVQRDAVTSPPAERADDTAPTTDGTAPPADGTAPPADDVMAEGSADAAPVVEIRAVDYTFQGVPETVELGTELRLFNAGQHVHDLNVWYVGDDARPTDELVPPTGAHVGVIVAVPGSVGQPAVVPDGGGPLEVAPLILDRPGRYMLYSTIGEDTDPTAVAEFLSRVADAGQDLGERPPFGSGEPGFAKGMYADLVVVADDPEQAAETVLDTLADDGRFDIVHELLTQHAPPQFVGFMSDPGWGLTFLAPVDEAFERRGTAFVEALRSDPNMLTRVLHRHVVLTGLSSDEFSDVELETVGEPVELRVTDDGATVDGAKIIATDLPAANGHVHAVDDVLVPPGLDLPE